MQTVLVLDSKGFILGFQIKKKRGGGATQTYGFSTTCICEVVIQTGQDELGDPGMNMDRSCWDTVFLFINSTLVFTPSVACLLEHLQGGRALPKLMDLGKVL